MDGLLQVVVQRGDSYETIGDHNSIDKLTLRDNHRMWYQLVLKQYSLSALLGIVCTGAKCADSFLIMLISNR